MDNGPGTLIVNNTEFITFERENYIKKLTLASSKL